MKTNEHLYGEGVVVPEIPQNIVDERIELLKIQLARLLDHSYYTRNGVRVKEIIDAISFWESINDCDK